VQGLLSRLGLTRSYVMINTFLYSLYGQSGSSYVSTPAIVTYRNQWLSTLMTRNPIRAVITLGTLTRLNS
jgi:uracil-DNA glycosylase